MRIGIDIGSTAAKAAALEGNDIVCTLVVPTGFNGVDAAMRLADGLRAQGIDPTACDAQVVATGDASEDKVYELTYKADIPGTFWFGADCQYFVYQVKFTPAQ